MNLLLDMGVAPRTGDYLRALGHDAVHLRDRGLAKLPDPEIVRLAQAESRVVVTFDLDFSRILAMHRLAKPSVILFRLEKFTTIQINQLLEDLLVHYSAELLAGAVIVVDPSRIRVRRLPIF
jgi:predicted nuclease of predicted toxin-antitoxin system